MKLSRRGLFKAAVAIPIAATVGIPHVHHYERDIAFFGWTCRCGAEVTDREARLGMTTRAQALQKMGYI